MGNVEQNNVNSLVCRYDYLKIANEKSHSFGVYCGQKTGKTVFVTGNYVAITFHSDYSLQRKGFLLFFNAFPPSKLNHNLH